MRDTYRETELIEALLGNDDGKQSVGEDPHSREMGAERLVRILERLFGALYRRDIGRECALDRGLELTVDICLWQIRFFDDSVLAVCSLFGLGRRKRFNLVGTLGTPGHIVPIAEGVHVENVDVRRHDEQVLGEGGEHVPRVHVQEGGDEIQTEGSSQGDNDDTNTIRSEEGLDECRAGASIEANAIGAGKGLNHEIHGQDDDVELDQTEDDEGDHVRPPRSLWSVSESQNELQSKEGEVHVLDDGVEDGRSVVAERPAVAVVVPLRLLTDEVHDDGGCEPERSQSKPGEEDGEGVVQHLDVEEEHADEVVSRLVHAAKVHQGVDTGGERTVQPTTTLTDEFSCTFRHIGFTLGRLDVGEMPLGSGLGDQLETENTIFGQEHVLLEDVHALDTLLSEDLGEGVITVEILLQWPTHDGAEPIGREGTGQHGDIAKGRFQRLIQDIRDLVLEILCSDERVEQVLPALTQHGVNLAASTTEILVIVEGLPKGEERFGTWFRSGIEQDADLRVEDTAESSEEPAMGVNLLGVLLLQAEHHLDWGECARAVVVRANQLLVRSH